MLYCLKCRKKTKSKNQKHEKKTADSRHIYINKLGKDLHQRQLLIKYYARKHLT